MKVICAVNNTPQAFQAAKFCEKMCSSMRSYELRIVFYVALNQKNTLPYLDHLEQGFNIEIQEQAEKDSMEIVKFLQTLDVKYEYEMISETSELGPLMEQHINKQEVDLVVCGTRNNGTLSRWVLGSLSDYLVHHVQVPVLVIKN
ncbi:hypothetical protein EDD86DRAFT_98874 [Gorgonomyces haynaldii]|nr:hypothetical protein EDD86DRAFT_98874 [Gorgonomyces haynaldii]